VPAPRDLGCPAGLPRARTERESLPEPLRASSQARCGTRRSVRRSDPRLLAASSSVPFRGEITGGRTSRSGQRRSPRSPILRARRSGKVRFRWTGRPAQPTQIMLYPFEGGLAYI
jgi:hypothetical protein